MPNLKLTQLAVDRLNPPASGRVEYWDLALPGFGLRISPAIGGRPPRKVWQVMYRVNGKLVRETLGTLATVPRLEAARELARASWQKAQAKRVSMHQRVRSSRGRDSDG